MFRKYFYVPKVLLCTEIALLPISNNTFLITFPDSISRAKNDHLTRTSSHEFSLAHYTGKVTYDVRELGDKNRDFLPPEMVETLRASSDAIVKILFTNKLSKTGNLTMNNEEYQRCGHSKKGKWGAALVAEKGRTRVTRIS